ncbi:MAG: type II secretion system protein [Phycisphaerales bacterium]|nr:type II secretion system protein [Phycisphaerales bacterium]
MPDQKAQHHGRAGRSRRGFSLIEPVVVMSVLGILAVVAAPNSCSAPRRRGGTVAAVEYLRTHALPEVIASPMREPAPRVETIPDPDPEPAPPEPEEISDAPTLQITAIVQSRQGAVAAVGHRMLRIGDEVAPGWLITAIDASERVVRVRHADGRMAEYTTFNPRSHAH